ncbi:MAG: hypothetical protein NTW29_00780 [Bacteroidetes bacterium]|nr:hypothetical protein [Bacteroidota bacterium]
MKQVYLLLFIGSCSCGALAQPQSVAHIITCISIVDKQGIPLALGSDSVETALFPAVYVYPDRNARDFTETIRKDEESNKLYFENFAGRSTVSRPPFKNDYFIISGYTREILVRRWVDDNEESMRIIFLNNKGRTDSTAITTYLLENIIFSPGTYEVDCNKTGNVQKGIYANILPLKMYSVKTALKPRTAIKIKPGRISQYQSLDFEFYANNLFIQHEGFCGPPDGTIYGKGVYKVSGTGVTLYYKKPADKKTGSSTGATIVKKNITGSQDHQLSIAVSDNNGEPVPGANILIKGTRRGMATDMIGNAVMTINKQELNSFIVLTIGAIGYKTIEIPVGEPASYQVNCILDMNTGDRYIDSGFVKKGVFTDFTPGYLGIYWLQPGEEFDITNQEQMSRREFYYNRKVKQRPMVRICPD